MAKLIQSLLLLATALYLSSLVGISIAKSEDFDIEGEVYCDKCRAQFINRLSVPIPGATVRLECRDAEKGELKYTIESKTDDKGNYKIKVDGDHEDQVCQVVLVSSPMEDCKDIPKEPFEKLSSRITLTNDSGIANKLRHANPMGFMVKEAIPECLKLYKELDMLPEEIQP